MGIFVGTLILAMSLWRAGYRHMLLRLLWTGQKYPLGNFIYLFINRDLFPLFVENVATVLIVAPIALALAKKLKLIRRK